MALPEETSAMPMALPVAVEPVALHRAGHLVVLGQQQGDLVAGPELGDRLPRGGQHIELIAQPP